MFAISESEGGVAIALPARPIQRSRKAPSSVRDWLNSSIDRARNVDGTGALSLPN